MPTTRAKRKAEGNELLDPPKEKYQTLGNYLAEQRDEQADVLLEDEKVAAYEMMANYNKQDIIEDLQLTENEPFAGQYFTNRDGLRVIFITLETGAHPKTYSHICNGSTAKWNLKNLNLSSIHASISLPSVCMLFVRGEHVKDAPKSGNIYKYLGLQGILSSSSDANQVTQITFSFDYVLSKKDLAELGAHVTKCVKNRYGATLCA